MAGRWPAEPPLGPESAGRAARGAAKMDGGVVVARLKCHMFDSIEMSRQSGLRKEAPIDGDTGDESQGTGSAGGVRAGEGGRGDAGEGVGAAGVELPPDAAVVRAVRGRRRGGPSARAAGQG